MSRSEELWDVLLARLLAVLEQKRISPEDLARRSGYNLKTIRRTLSGQTKSLDALNRLEAVLRADILDSQSPQQLKDDSERFRTFQLGHPIVGWETAARVLRVSRITLWRKRKRYDPKREPWWPTETALRAWYDGLMSGESQVGAK